LHADRAPQLKAGVRLLPHRSGQQGDVLMMMVKKKFASLLIFAIASICVALPERQANQRSGTPDWNGTWVLQKSDDGKNKSSQVTGNVTLVISQTGQEIKIARKHHETSNETVQELTYYTDGRGEMNPTSDGKRSLKSNTKQTDNKLIIRFSMPSSTINKTAIVNERIDEWKLSSDGQTLTQTSSFTSSSSASDASHNPYGSPRAPNILASPLRWKEKRIFKRIS
jgi:hypothetical protein